ncbi:ParA family protein [Phormidium yuhuli AB48]|uniref:ParA family protein n=1 Tax=Phormidium yuhuli AB48 TaxID=2940671 RepID=A0ABY5AJY6_9CYAN|nr:ParA family protein [Phormidium yuhuli]USR89505.1 ParA family protein [Phormidium yuhuli AB48]
MKVILCTHNSGGVGKTTLAVHLAGYLSEWGEVLLVDCDEQADSWKFFMEKEPGVPVDQGSARGIEVIANPERRSLKKLKVKPNQFDFIVIDIDTVLENTVQVILNAHPDLIFIPLNRSHMYKSIDNLASVLEMVGGIDGNPALPYSVVIVPLGIDKENIERELERIEYHSEQYLVADSMEDLSTTMDKVIYKDRKYIWDCVGLEHNKNYFKYLAFNTSC